MGWKVKTKNQIDPKQLKLQQEEINDLPKRETFEKLHSHKPVTRRDFLSTGLLGFGASMTLPSLATMLAPSVVNAQTSTSCAAAALSDMCAFVGIKGSGGFAISANAMPLDRGGQLLSSYSRIGMGLGSRVQVTYEFANRVPFYSASGIVAGIRAEASALTLANTVFIPNWYTSQDDNSMNKQDITGAVIAAGLAGSKLKNLGRSNTETGVNNSYAYVRPPAPLVVGRYEDIVGSLGVSGALATLNETQKGNLFRNIQNLTSSQAAAIQNMTGGELLSRLLNCANIDNTNLIANAASLNIDPLSNAQLATVWNINNNSNRGSQDFVFASMVFNALNGNASTVNLDIGGCDYHNGTRTAGDARDLDIGRVIGNTLESAAVMGKKVFIHVTTDGAVTGPESDDPGGIWSSDRGNAGGSYIIAYDPAGPHSTMGNQIGHYTSGQAADGSFLTGGSTELASAAVFANYLSFNNKMNLLEQVLPRVFETSQIDTIRKIA